MLLKHFFNGGQYPPALNYILANTHADIIFLAGNKNTSPCLSKLEKEASDYKVKLFELLNEMVEDYIVEEPVPDFSLAQEPGYCFNSLHDSAVVLEAFHTKKQLLFGLVMFDKESKTIDLLRNYPKSPKICKLWSNCG